MDRVTVLHLITDLSTGGAQTALLRQLEAFDRGRFAPVVVCLYGGDRTIAQQIRTLTIPVFDLKMSTRWRWGALWRLYRLLRRERPAILHTWMFHANFLGRIVGRLANVPVVITSRRNVDIGGDLREFLNRWTSGLDDAVVAVCESARELEIERSRVAPDKVITIYNGVAIGQFVVSNRQAAAHLREAFGIPLGAPLLGSVGRLHLQKGFADLLTALVRVQAHVPDVRLLLVGGGELRSELEAQAQAMGLLEAVIFAGARTDVPEILAGLDVFVLPSLWEGLSNAVLEAMAAGLPVVATGVGGTPEIVVDGVTGFLVAPGDAGALARSIARLLCDPALRRRMGQAGRERVAQRFTVGRMVEQTQELYERLLREKGIILDGEGPAR